MALAEAWAPFGGELELALKHVCQFPALLLWGDRDRAVAVESAEPLKQCFAQAEFAVIPGAGHLPYEECPETFTCLANSFLSRMRGHSEAGPQLVVREPSHAKTF